MKNTPAPITDNQALQTLIDQMRPSDYIAVDTEFHREKTYHSHLCLIQVGTDDVTALVDPLSEQLDLRPLLDFLLEKERVKVFHAGKQDLEIFYTLTGKMLEPFFDTQIAAMALGLGHQIGYANLVQSILSKNLSKGQQMTNWTRRPLTEAQAGYALDDVVYLRPLYKEIRNRLEEKNRLHWLQEEEERLAEGIMNPPDPDKLWKSVRTRDKAPRTLTAIKELALWRDVTAQKEDKPRGSLIKDEALATIARARPTTEQELNDLRGVPGDVKRKYGQEIFALMQQVNDLPNEDLIKPERRKKSEEVDNMMSSLAALYLRFKSADANVTANLIANNADLDAFLKGDPSPLAKGWRYELVGQDIEKLVNGEVAITVKDGKMVSIPLD